MRLICLLLLPLVLVACAGDHRTSASMSREEAMQQLGGAVSTEVNDGASGLYRHRLRFVRIDRGLNPSGEAAWVGTFDDRTAGDRVCVVVWKHQVGVAVTITYEVTTCRQTGRTVRA